MYLEHINLEKYQGDVELAWNKIDKYTAGTLPIGLKISGMATTLLQHKGVVFETILSGLGIGPVIMKTFAQAVPWMCLSFHQSDTLG